MWGQTLSELAPLDLIAARPWRRVSFTTFALSLSFFEAVILDHLVRGAAREALIFSDKDGVRAALSEQGARRVGRDYHVEPIAVTGGVFHSKLTVLADEDACNLLVGSGNLTFGGWGGNLEVIEHLHPNFAADAFEDAAQFFEFLATASNVHHGAADRFFIVARDLRLGLAGKSRNGNIRLLHSLGTSVTDQVAGLAVELGGATRLLAAAPYWDGVAFDRLCRSLGLDHAFIHAHHETVRGQVGANWPTSARTSIKAVAIDVLDSKRPLHAKAFEILCKRGRIIISGSANGTSAALHNGGNVETVVARIYRQKSIGWTYSHSEPPDLKVSLEDDAEEEDRKVGVLRAVLDGDEIKGEVIWPPMIGEASAHQITSEGPHLLLQRLQLDLEGKFNFRVPGFELKSWSGTRLVLRISEKNGRLADGFVLVAAYSEISRRLGSIAPKIMAILAGNETPEDVGAIMSWFHEDPRRLLGIRSRISGSGGADKENDNDPNRTISVSELLPHELVDMTETSSSQGNKVAAWARFMQNLFATFRTPQKSLRGSTAQAASDETDDDIKTQQDSDQDEQRKQNETQVRRGLAIFERLLGVLLSGNNAPLYALEAFDLTSYICSRLDPEFSTAKRWLGELVRTFIIHNGIPKDRKNDINAAILVLHAADGKLADLRRTRSRLRDIGAALEGPTPEMLAVKGFLAVFRPEVDFDALWLRILGCRTYPEQIQQYLRTWKTGEPTDGYPDIPTVAPNEWPLLKEAITSPEARESILVVSKPVDACPNCHIVLPGQDRDQLLETGVAVARNCCGAVIVCGEL